LVIQSKPEYKIWFKNKEIDSNKLVEILLNANCMDFMPCYQFKIMGQIIKQPNGKFIIFSSIVDNVTHYDMTAEDIVELWKEDNREKSIRMKIDKINRGENPYHIFKLSYEDVFSKIESVHGKEVSEDVKAEIEL
tara:strand:- start:2021 stop:2425 length:405 start_codon:yes stop_codon:yes gene_type:complete